MSHLRPVPTVTREERVAAFAAVLASSHDARREVAEAMIDGIDRMDAAADEIQRLRARLAEVGK